MRQSNSIRCVPALAIAAGVAWIPSIAVFASRLPGGGLPDTVPIHADINGQADAWQPAQAVFALDLTAGVVSAVLVTLIVVMVGSDLSRLGGSALLAGISLVAGTYSLTWFWSVGMAGEHVRRSTSFGETALWGVVIAGVIFVLGALPRPHHRPRPAPEESTDDTRSGN